MRDGSKLPTGDPALAHVMQGSPGNRVTAKAVEVMNTNPVAFAVSVLMSISTFVFAGPQDRFDAPTTSASSEVASC